MPPSARELLAALRDPLKFAEVLCGAPLWEHQAAVIRSPARYRIICAGRQCGKSRTMAVMALHEAFSKPRGLVLIVSATENAAKRVLAEIASIATAALLAPSVVDETKSTVTLSNGSQILSVPASEKQVRGWSVDLLILDEAAYIGQDLWQAAEPAIIARPGSRVVMASTPAGTAEHFFRKLWQRGTDRADAMFESFHWPSTVSPLVDEAFLEEIRARETDRYFRSEFLAEWLDDSGSFLTEEEIASAVASYDLMTPEQAGAQSPWSRELERRERHFTAVAGVDWAFSRDAQALVLLAAMDDGGMNPRPDHVYYIPWLAWEYRTRYADWVTAVADSCAGYGIRAIASESNGVGAGPTEALSDEVMRRGLGACVAPVWTDARRKQSGFGKIKMMLQRDLLVLPREPELLKQLRALEFEQMPGGSVKIAVPERAGHDDLAMALMQAVSCVRPAPRGPDEIYGRPELAHTITASGIRVPMSPRPVEWHAASYCVPSGRQPDSAAW